MKLGGGMRKGIIRRKHRKRKKQRRKLGIRLVRYRLNRGVVGLGDRLLMVMVVMVGSGVLRLKDRVKWDLLSSGNNNNSDLNHLLNNNNNNPRNNNTEVLLFNINPLLSSTNNNNNHHLDHLNFNNNSRINKCPVDIPKDKDNNKIDYLHRVINPLLSPINPNSYSSNNNNNNNNRNRDGRINLNPLLSLSPRKLFLLLINLGIDPPRLRPRLNNRRIMSLGHCTSAAFIVIRVRE
jgi:hypothetical protein